MSTRHKKHGQITCEVAKLLFEKLATDFKKYPKLSLYHDHDLRLSNPHACKCYAYFSGDYNRTSTLSAIDICITYGNEVLVAVEIEEHPERPKALIGDIYGIALSSRVRIKGCDYYLRNTRVVIFSVCSYKGDIPKKLEKLQNLVNKFLIDIPECHRSVKKVNIIPTSLIDLKRRSERAIRNILHKQINNKCDSV